ncbi:MAG: hypothetical protein CFE46_11240 [Burkholderiales bacterium PBB6]|nr:MAG: hypothetical protein CFE46_11240 [Burkholderiales bacterium PBB6]
MSGSKAVGPTMYGAVRPPAQMGGPAVEADLTNMARLRVHRRLPVVLSQGEIAAVFQALQGEHRLLAQVLYGTGMRLFEGLQLRIKDVDFFHQIIVVHCGKGDKDRLLILPPRLMQALRGQVARAHMAWQQGHQAACDISAVQDLLGHADVTTTMHYTQYSRSATGGGAAPRIQCSCADGTLRPAGAGTSSSLVVEPLGSRSSRPPTFGKVARWLRPELDRQKERGEQPAHQHLASDANPGHNGMPHGQRQPQHAAYQTSTLANVDHRQQRPAQATQRQRHQDAEAANARPEGAGQHQEQQRGHRQQQHQEDALDDQQSGKKVVVNGHG